MKTNIHPYLIARFIAVQSAFLQPGFRFSSVNRNSQPIAAAKGNNWDKAKDEDEDDSGGGGGTIRGNRGKNAVHAAAMKRLTRGGRR